MTSRTRSQLEDFAEAFIKDISHHGEVRTELLAESFRRAFDLPPFPTIGDLRELCGRLGIPLWRLPEGIPGVDAANISMDGEVAILLNRGLPITRQETSLAHEIREAIENAFQRVKPSYEGLPTHDNRRMNHFSDRFAGYLLMETRASQSLMREMGFDFVAFAEQTGRSLPSVVRRATQLFSSKSGKSMAPVMGVWLFEAPWEAVQERRAGLRDLCVRHTAKLAGFTLKSGSITGRVFPQDGASGADFNLVRMTVAEGRCHSVLIAGMGLDESMDYLVRAEPMFPWGLPWRVLVTAVRRDGSQHLTGARLLRLHEMPQQFQRL